MTFLSQDVNSLYLEVFKSCLDIYEGYALALLEVIDLM